MRRDWSAKCSTAHFGCSVLTILTALVVVGDVFDVAHMEAMLTVPVAGTPGNVETVLRPGYILQGDRILRAAQVGVGAAEGSSAG